MERGCVVLDQPQHAVNSRRLRTCHALRLVEDDTAALRTRQNSSQDAMSNKTGLSDPATCCGSQPRIGFWNISWVATWSWWTTVGPSETSRLFEATTGLPQRGRGLQPKAPHVCPNGAGASSPGLPSLRGYPGKSRACDDVNPERVVAHGSRRREPQPRWGRNAESTGLGQAIHWSV